MKTAIHVLLIILSIPFIFVLAAVKMITGMAQSIK